MSYNGACPERSRRNNATRLTQLTRSGTGTVTIGYDSADRRITLTCLCH